MYRCMLVLLALPPGLCVYGPSERCRDVDGHTFPSGALYFQDGQNQCQVMFCESGRPRIVLNMCNNSESCITDSGRALSAGQQSWESVESDCRLLECRGRRTAVLRTVHCYTSSSDCTAEYGLHCCRTLPVCTAFCTRVPACPLLLLQPQIQRCLLPTGEMGIVCPPSDAKDPPDVPQDHPTDRQPHQHFRQIRRSNLTGLSQQLLMATPSEDVSQNPRVANSLRRIALDDGGRSYTAALKEAQKQTDQLQVTEDRLRQQGKVPGLRSSTNVFGQNFRTSARGHRAGLAALPMLLSVSALLAAQNASDECSHYGCMKPRMDDDLDQSPSCDLPVPAICDFSSPFRTADGTCNNVDNPLWGSRVTPLRRLFQNTYSDGVFLPTSSAGLPSARVVSARVMDSTSNPADVYTLSVMTWGQFVDHDLIHTPIFHTTSGDPIECCQPSSETPPTPPLHPRCFPIEIPADDVFYGFYGQRCMNFVRSVPALPADCSPAPAEQLNDITHWLDGSQVYGSSSEAQMRLREGSGGRMATSGGNLLPLEELSLRPGSGFSTNCRGCTCFEAGDSRSNENPVLALYHTLFVREHNRVAAALQTRHPDWPDETLFQQARRVVVAQWQHITYAEWLPTLIGYNYARSLDLLPLESGYSYTYFPFFYPNIANEFGTAGFRLHSLIQDVIDYVQPAGGPSLNQSLVDGFFEPSTLTSPLLFAALARGVSSQKPQSFDRRVTMAVRGLLFSDGRGYGLDLVSLNVQRGRDHGIAAYTTALQWCTGLQVSRWTDLLAVISADGLSRLRAVYQQPSQVDLYVGLNMERPTADGALLGPTTRCLLAEQFLRLRYADRYFYDLAFQPGSFTENQLQQLRRTSWAAILCNNAGPGFLQVQHHAFFQPLTFFNPVNNCSDIPSPDLSVF